MSDQIHLTLPTIGSEEKETESVRTGKHLWHLMQGGRKSWSLLWGFWACPGERQAALLDHRWERQLKKARAFPGRRCGRTPLSLRGWPLGNRPCSKRVYGPHKLDLVVFPFSLSFSYLLFFGEGHERWEGGPGATGNWMWSGRITWQSQIINKILCKKKKEKKKTVVQDIYYICFVWKSNGKITKS